MPAWLLPVARALLGSGTQLFGQQRQKRHNEQLAQQQNQMNRENMEYSFQQNQKMLEQQLAYDSPEAQMARYKKAGLNPHLIYGQGSSGNQGQPLQFGQAPSTNIQNTDMQLPNASGMFMQAMMQQSQLGLNQTRQENISMNTQAQQVQTEIARTNPMLQPRVAEWVSSSMEEIARLKTLESRYLTHQNPWETFDQTKAGQRIMAETEGLIQKLGLNNIDLQIRNKIFESKEFENALKEIQMNWLKQGDVTPEHIRQGLMLLLSKMIGR